MVKSFISRLQKFEFRKTFFKYAFFKLATFIKIIFTPNILNLFAKAHAIRVNLRLYLSFKKKYIFKFC